MKCPQNMLRSAASVVVAALLTSCSGATFYAQAFQGQREIFKKARPVAEVKADPKTRPLLKQRLEVVANMLAFADKELGLPAKGQYERYTDLKRPYVVWVVFAAPEFSVEGKTWWYPIIGRLKYRGFFDEKLANEEAARLRKQGLDVYVSGVSAYSTLGYFRDPLLNTFLGQPESNLAELIFHELTHQRLYLKGDTDFNEALATSVGRAGAVRWLKARGKKHELALYLKERRVSQEFIGHVLQAREDLSTVYAAPHLNPARKRRAKAATIEHLRQDLLAMNGRYGGSLQINKWFEKPVNNARLSTLSTYYTLVPEFDALQAKHGGKLDPFFAEVQSMGSLTKEQRTQRLHTLAGHIPDE